MARQKLPDEVREFFVKMGRMGGKIGGKARAANLSDKQRSDAARKAVQARWAKAKLIQQIRDRKF